MSCNPLLNIPDCDFRLLPKKGGCIFIFPNCVRFTTLLNTSVTKPHRCGRTWCHSLAQVQGAQWPCSCGPVGKHHSKPSSCDGCCADPSGRSCPQPVLDPASVEESVFLRSYWRALLERRLTPLCFWSVDALCERLRSRFAAGCDAHSLYPPQPRWPIQLWQVILSSRISSCRLGCARSPATSPVTQWPAVRQRHLQVCSVLRVAPRCRRTPGWSCGWTVPAVNGTPQPPQKLRGALRSDCAARVVPQRVNTDPHQHRELPRPPDWRRFAESVSRLRPRGLQVWSWRIYWAQQGGEVGWNCFWLSIRAECVFGPAQVSDTDSPCSVSCTPARCSPTESGVSTVPHVRANGADRYPNAPEHLTRESVRAQTSPWLKCEGVSGWRGPTQRHLSLTWVMGWCFEHTRLRHAVAHSITAGRGEGWDVFECVIKKMLHPPNSQQGAALMSQVNHFTTVSWVVSPWRKSDSLLLHQ